MAVVLAAAAAVLLVVAAAVGPDGPTMWLRVVFLGAAWTGPLFLLAALFWAARHRIERLVGDRLLDIAGPSLIRAMAPRNVLGSLLPWIYGADTDHQDVLTAILGGAGRDLGGRDTAVSRSTTAHFRLWAVDDLVWASESTWTHEFSGVRKSHKFVVFATHSESIAERVAQERIFPLFELWNFSDEDQLDEFVDRAPRTFEIGITYTDVSGVLHRVPPRVVAGEEVPLRQFDQFVRLSDDIDRKDLYIVAFDLWDLADPDHVVETIQSLTVTARSQVDVDLGFFTWSPPHPSFVRAVTFDVADLVQGGTKYEFRIVPFVMRNSAVVLTQWQESEDRMQVPIDSWMLPGHGVTLLWRTTV